MAAMLAPAGCSIGGDEEPQPASGAPKAIAATVDRLERAIAAEDFATVCNELFTRGARERSGGADCPAQLRSTAEGLQRPGIEVRGFVLEGDRARVAVVTTARGQARVPDELLLTRSDGRWLVEAVR